MHKGCIESLLETLVGVQAASDQEAVGLPQGEELAGTEMFEHYLL